MSKYNFHGHDEGLVVTQPEAGKFHERPMTIAEIEAREPAHKIAADIYRHANYAGVCYYEIWDLIAKAAQMAVDRTVGPGCTQALLDVVGERARQMSAEGWTFQHDDGHDRGELARAAACYAQCAGIGIAHAAGLETHYEFVAEYKRAGCPHALWPWALNWWKPKDPRRDLVRAAALILAEIERIDRAAARG